MSLILNNNSPTYWKCAESDPAEEQRDASLLDRYLALMEYNKQASQFAPSDALIALDMAGFVLGKIAGAHSGPQVSTARLALALAQPQPQAPIQ